MIKKSISFVLLNLLFMSYSSYSQIPLFEDYSKRSNETQAYDQFYDEQPDVLSCNIGKLKEIERQKVLTEVNIIRKLHGLNPVTYTSANDKGCMESSLINVANYTSFGFSQQNHEPPQTWKCWTQDGFNMAQKTNLYISTGNPASEQSVIAWIIDRNVESLGHRRWIINPYLKEISFGRSDGKPDASSTSTMSSMALYCHDISSNANYMTEDFVAYPYHFYPPKYLDKQWLMSFTVIADKSGMWANQGKVDHTSTTITINEENGTPLQIFDTGYDHSTYGTPNCFKWSVTGLKEHTRYNVQINNVKVNGASKNYTYWFQISDPDQQAPAAITLTEPTNNATEVPLNATLKWASESNVTKYHVQVASDQNFTNLIAENENYISNSFPINGLEAESKVFWRVRGKNDGGIGPWSVVFSFTTMKAPDYPQFISPSADAQNVSVTPNFTWTKINNIQFYELQVSKEVDFNNNKLDKTSIYSESYQVENFEKLDLSTTYFWRLRTKSDVGYSPWSPYSSFSTVGALPDGPELKYPDNGQADIPLNVTLEWGAVTGANSYNLQISNVSFTNAQPENIVVDITNYPNTSYQVPEGKLVAKKNHFWRVAANTAQGTTDWVSRRFTTSDVSSVEDQLKHEIDLQLLPNPVSNNAEIRFFLKYSSFVEISLYTTNGILLKNLHSDILNLGEHRISFSTSDLPIGAYLYVIKIGKLSTSGTLQIIR